MLGSSIPGVLSRWDSECKRKKAVTAISMSLELMQELSNDACLLLKSSVLAQGCKTVTFITSKCYLERSFSICQGSCNIFLAKVFKWEDVCVRACTSD